MLKQYLKIFIAVIIAGIVIATVMYTLSWKEETLPQSEIATIENATETLGLAELHFEIDEGIRADYASNPFVISVEGSKIVLAYESRSSQLKEQPEDKIRYIESEDGVTFTPLSGDELIVRSRAVQVADGTYRRYIFNPSRGGITSESSMDGVTFTEDEGLRYELGEGDTQMDYLEKFGVSTYFTNQEGGVVLLHNETQENGDVVVSRLYSAPETNGLTFVRGEENILAGSLERDHFMDPSAVALSDGSIKLVIMHQDAGPAPPQGRTGELYLYESTDDGKTFTLEGLIVSWEDFTEFEVRSLNDPKFVEMPDGTLRIYVAAMVPDETFMSGDEKDRYKWVIVSVAQNRRQTQ